MPRRLASADNVVAAPMAAIFTETNPETRSMERYVFVKRGESWERQAVEIGVSDYFFVEDGTAAYMLLAEKLAADPELLQEAHDNYRIVCEEELLAGGAG